MSELGEALAAERRRAGRTVAEVEAATKIRGRLIEALERGETERLPSPAYVRGYILSYARYLEIPAEPLLEIHRRESGVAPPEERAPRAQPRVPRREDLHLIPMRTALAIAGVTALAALAVWGIARLVSPRDDRGPAPLPPAATPTSTPGAVASESVTPTGTGAAEPSAPAAEGDTVPAGAEFTVKVTVRRGEASWIIAKVDGLRAYEGMMTDGESKSWLVKSEASIGMGRPTAVTVYREGTKVTDRPQVIGKVPTIVLTAEP